MIPRPNTPDVKSGYSAQDLEFFALLQQDYPEYRFIQGRKFTFRPPRTIVIGSPEPYARLLTLHELGHALSGHHHFDTDIKRLKMELEAWEKARSLSAKYKLTFNENLMQRELDTYRDWLHQKSRCPDCGLTRFETPDGQYHCPRCDSFRLS